jgi:hypothetical protein
MSTFLLKLFRRVNSKAYNPAQHVTATITKVKKGARKVNAVALIHNMHKDYATVIKANGEIIPCAKLSRRIHRPTSIVGYAYITENLEVLNQARNTITKATPKTTK